MKTYLFGISTYAHKMVESVLYQNIQYKGYLIMLQRSGEQRLLV